MTSDEIRLVAFILLALALGSFVKWQKDVNQTGAPATVALIPERPSTWANPPYVFKSRAAMEKVKETAREESQP